MTETLCAVERGNLQLLAYRAALPDLTHRNELM